MKFDEFLGSCNSIPTIYGTGYKFDYRQFGRLGNAPFQGKRYECCRDYLVKLKIYLFFYPSITSSVWIRRVIDWFIEEVMEKNYSLLVAKFYLLNSISLVKTKTLILRY